MPDWAVFVGLSALVLSFLLVLTRASQGYVTDEDDRETPDADRDTAEARRNGGTLIGQDPTLPDPEAFDPVDDGPGQWIEPDEDEDDGRSATADPDEDDPPGAATPNRKPPALRTLDGRESPELSSTALLVNVAASQLAFGVLLVFGAWFASIPPSALGLSDLSIHVVAVGGGLGLALYVANEAGATLADRLGYGHDERLRELLAPTSIRGWILLLVVVLPVIAGFEEFLFRAALIGAVSAGYGVSPWLLAGASSVAFGLGHGAQGRGGMVVTTALGLVLAAAFVLTGSFVVVFVAHYLVNALEFLVHEGLGIEWAR